VFWKIGRGIGGANFISGRGASDGLDPALNTISSQLFNFAIHCAVGAGDAGDAAASSSLFGAKLIRCRQIWLDLSTSEAKSRQN